MVPISKYLSLYVSNYNSIIAEKLHIHLNNIKRYKLRVFGTVTKQNLGNRIDFL